MERDPDEISSNFSRASRAGVDRNANKRTAANVEDDSSQGIAWGSKAGTARDSAVPKISQGDDYDSYGGRRGGAAEKSDRNTGVKASIAGSNKLQQMKSNEVSSILQWSEEPFKPQNAIAKGGRGVGNDEQRVRGGKAVNARGGGQANMQEDADMLSFNPSKQQPLPRNQGRGGLGNDRGNSELSLGGGVSSMM